MDTTTTQKNGSGKKNGKGKLPPNLAAAGAKAGVPPIADRPKAPAPEVHAKQPELPGTSASAVPKAVQEHAEQLAGDQMALKRAQAKVQNGESHLLFLMDQHKVPLLVVVDEDGDRQQYFVDTKRKVKRRKLKDQSASRGRGRRRG